MPLVRICAGGGEQSPSLPRPIIHNVDSGHSALARMTDRRTHGYRAMGYRSAHPLQRRCHDSKRFTVGTPGQPAGHPPPPSPRILSRTPRRQLLGATRKRVDALRCATMRGVEPARIDVPVLSRRGRR